MSYINKFIFSSDNLIALAALAELHLNKSIVGGGYMCNLCSKHFRDKTAGKEHLESIHFPPKGGYTCEICYQQIATKAALRAHKRKHVSDGFLV